MYVQGCIVSIWCGSLEVGPTCPCFYLAGSVMPLSLHCLPTESQKKGHEGRCCLHIGQTGCAGYEQRGLIDYQLLPPRPRSSFEMSLATALPTYLGRVGWGVRFYLTSLFSLSMPFVKTIGFTQKVIDEDLHLVSCEIYEWEMGHKYIEVVCTGLIVQ